MQLADRSLNPGARAMTKEQAEQPGKSNEADRRVSWPRPEAASKLTARRQRPGLLAEIADLLHNLARRCSTPTGRELHYMRGRGPSGTPSMPA